MSVPSYSGGKPAIGDGQAATASGLAAMYQYSSPEAAAFGIRLPNPYWGVATVAGGGTTVAVVFDEPRANADYQVFTAFDEDPGSAVATFASAKTVNGFTLNTDADPITDADVLWIAFG